MNSEANRGKNVPPNMPRAIGNEAAKIEGGAIRLGTAGVYRFRERHPWVYGLIAYLIGSGLIAIIIVISYENWSFEGVNLKAAVYELVGGAFAGGVVMVVLAFAYARTIRPAIASPVKPWETTQGPSAKG